MFQVFITAVVWMIIVGTILIMARSKNKGTGTPPVNSYRNPGAAPGAGRPGGAMAGGGQTGAGRPGGTMAGGGQTGSGGTGANPAAFAAEPSEKELSTTEYLEQKAQEDQREHARERLEEQRRVDQKYGRRPVGGRYLPGDPVPRGMKIVCCRYCGAENLVNEGYRKDRDCYFCRTNL